MGRREGERLPALALVHLAVAHDEEDPILPALEPIAQGKAHRLGRALAQGPGGDVDAGGLVPIAVAGEPGAALVQGLQLLIGEDRKSVV